jgi:hypothetical protein
VYGRDAFRSIFNTDNVPLYFLGDNTSDLFTYLGEDITKGAYTVGPSCRAGSNQRVSLIKFLTTWINPFSAQLNVVHELGHLFGNTILGWVPSNSVPQEFINKRSLILLGKDPITGTIWQQNIDRTGSETFADMFVAWSFNGWRST